MIKEYQERIGKAAGRFESQKQEGGRGKEHCEGILKCFKKMTMTLKSR
jgi:hypothetical protein